MIIRRPLLSVVLRLKEEREAVEKAAAEAAEQSKQAEQTQEAEQAEIAPTRGSCICTTNYLFLLLLR